MIPAFYIDLTQNQNTNCYTVLHFEKKNLFYVFIYLYFNEHKITKNDMATTAPTETDLPRIRLAQLIKCLPLLSPRMLGQKLTIGV